MRITQKGDYIRFQLIEKVSGGWTNRIDFQIHKDRYEELKKHMIEALDGFKLEGETD